VKSRYLIFLLLLLSNNATALEVSIKKNPASGLLSWLVNEPEISLKVIQVTPDYASAIFSSRGLPPRLVKTLQDYCVFGTIIKNKSAGALAYRVADWRFITPDGQAHAVKTKTEWIKQWANLGVPYRWLILPDDQVFGVGDWSQGFTTIKLPPNSTFDLNYSWRYKGETHQRTIKKIRCAPAEVSPPSKGS